MMLTMAMPATMRSDLIMALVPLRLPSPMVKYGRVCLWVSENIRGDLPMKAAAGAKIDRPYLHLTEMRGERSGICGRTSLCGKAGMEHARNSFLEWFQSDRPVQVAREKYFAWL